MTRRFPFASGLAAALVAGLALAAAAPAAATAASDSPRAAVTRHTARLHGGPVAYEAIVAGTEVRSEDGEASATVVTTSYVRTDAPSGPRPVLFIFNGGPGASTTPLHFSAFGPMRRFGEGDDQYLAGNPHSLLDAADLVFIDPVGTGYSRPAGDGAPFWSRTGDARSVAQVIRDWLARHDRAGSPRYLLGQSYGTIRAAEITRVAPDLDFDGVLLFALVPGERGGPLGHMASLPSYAAAAWHHGRVARDGRTVEQVYADAVVFARNDYLPALVQGAALPAADREAMARRLAAITGLPADLIAAHDLRIDNQLFMFNLLKDQGLRTGQLDARATARLDAPARRPPYDDPGMNYGPESAARAADPDETVFRAAGDESVVDAWYRDALGFAADDAYQALNLEVNSAWDHEGFADAIPHLAEAMARDPDLRVFWSAGYYDLSTPAYGGRYTLDQAGVPGDRLTAAYFASGHSVFIEETNLQALADAVRAFMTPAR